jgi:MoaA/NifB/PqqE/SkfB family radical SAM enzyme
MSLFKEALTFTRNARLVYDVNFARVDLRERLPGMARLGLKAAFDVYDAPISLLIAVTGRCQCDCRHCGVSYLHSKEQLSASRIETLLREYRSMGGWRVVFSGGEPLLRQDLSQLIECASGLGLASLIDTNALALDSEKVRELKEAGLCVVELSIDSMDAEAMDTNRRAKGVLAGVKSAMKLCRAQNLPFAVNTVAFRDSLDGGIDEIIAYCRQAGARYVRLLEPIACGQAPTEDFLLNPEERERMRARYEPGFVVLEQVGKTGANCSGINGRYLSVTPDGTVNPCPYMSVPLGNVKEQSLRQIVRSTRERFADMKACEEGCGDTTCIVNDPIFRSKFIDPVDGKGETDG